MLADYRRFSSPKQIHNHCKMYFDAIQRAQIYNNMLSKFEKTQFKPYLTSRTFFNRFPNAHAMFWLDVDNPTQTATLHTGECIHITPKTTDKKGVNQMKIDGGWFSFNTVGEAMRHYKVNKLSCELTTCLYCKPLEAFPEISMARLDVTTPRTGCDIKIKELEVLDTKSSYRRLLSKLLGPR